MANQNSVATIAGVDVRTRELPTPLKSLHPDPLLNRLYNARHVPNPEALDPSLKHLLHFSHLAGIADAVELLVQARNEHWRVLVVGDYDTDGATSTALAILGLTAMGIEASFLLPNRFEFGYGLSPEIVDLAMESNPDLIVTVDNGISSIEGVAKAKDAGVKVLVTDHHLAGAQLPTADAIVNPNQPDCSFPSKAACGCLVLYYCLIALRSRLRDDGVQALPNLGDWLDIVALATVADVVPLDANNRRIVTQGLQRIRAGHCRPGIVALMEVAGRDAAVAMAGDFGFVVGPRLNAAGRLDDMTLGVQLLLADSLSEARIIASQLHELNQERRQIEASMVTEATRTLATLETLESKSGIVVSGADWHEGVIGILASRIKDKHHRPVVAFAPAENGTLKGSARSVSGVHLRDCLDWIAKKDASLMSKFGGHAMAAGLSIDADRLHDFEAAFSQAVEALADEDALTPHLLCDGELESSDLNVSKALALEQAGPWGQNFPEPVFIGNFDVISARVLTDKHLKFTVRHGSIELDAICFNAPHDVLHTQHRKITALYQLSCNRFRGNTTAQLLIRQFESA